jgi:hypothetical protein
LQQVAAGQAQVGVTLQQVAAGAQQVGATWQALAAGAQQVGVTLQQFAAGAQQLGSTAHGQQQLGSAAASSPPPKQQNGKQIALAVFAEKAHTIRAAERVIHFISAHLLEWFSETNVGNSGCRLRRDCLG